MYTTCLILPQIFCPDGPDMSYCMSTDVILAWYSNMQCSAYHVICTPVIDETDPAVWLFELGGSIPDIYLADARAKHGTDSNQSMLM